MTRHPAKVDVAVLLLFFTRSDTFRQVFEAVRQARPSRLFLYQDGPRGERDMAGIEACRQIVSDEQIDWECDVHRNYLEHNQGCDPSGFRSHQWAFSLADKVIVLEDDVVPSQSFFTFCKEMLDRYEHDERVSMIAGFNTDEVTPDVPYDYFFTSFMSIWGWASWRRVAQRWEADYAFMNDRFNLHQLEAMAKARNYRNTMLQMFRDHSQSGKEYFETIYWADMILNSGLCVMPTKNLVNNVGMTTDSTHFSAELKTMPGRLRRIFTMPRYELTFPLKHPKYVVEHVEYKDRRYKVMGWNHPWTKIGYSLEELWLSLKAGKFNHISQSLARRIRKWMGRDKHK
ncbi:MAG: hemolysin activation protein [Prevotella sp.]|nr:hemolysin activation protein [Prevotella sp.]